MTGTDAVSSTIVTPPGVFSFSRHAASCLVVGLTQAEWNLNDESLGSRAEVSPAPIDSVDDRRFWQAPLRTADCDPRS